MTNTQDTKKEERPYYMLSPDEQKAARDKQKIENRARSRDEIKEGKFTTDKMIGQYISKLTADDIGNALISFNENRDNFPAPLIGVRVEKRILDWCTEYWLFAYVWISRGEAEEYTTPFAYIRSITGSVELHLCHVQEWSKRYLKTFGKMKILGNKSRRGGPVPRSKEDKRVIVEGWRDNSLNLKQGEFCKKERIHPSTLTGWIKEYDEGKLD